MLVELENNLNIIYDDIKNKLLPENIKKDITILGVTGNYGGDSEPKTFEFSEIAATYSAKLADPNKNYGTSDHMIVDGSNDWIYRAYLKYDINKFIGKKVKIVEAKLKFYIQDIDWGDYASQSDVFAAAATSDWNEKTLTWNNQPAKPSYIDEQNTPSITNPQKNTWRTIDVTNIVQRWFEGLGNTGICLSARNEGQYRHQWGISNRRRVGYASTLTVTFQNKELIDTLDATATANDLVMGKTAYAVNEKITGALEVSYGYTGVATNPIYNGHSVEASLPVDNKVVRGDITTLVENEKLAEIIELTPEKIAKGNTILGVEGTAEGSEDLQEQLDNQDRIIAEMQEALENKTSAHIVLDVTDNHNISIENNTLIIEERS